PMGMETLVYFTLDGTQVCGRVNPNAGAHDGAPFRLAVDLNNMHLLNEVTGVVILRPQARSASGGPKKMVTNKKKILVTESMSQRGRALLNERDDIELIEFPNMISAKDFEAMLKAQAPVHGVALGATRFGETELEASGDMKVVTRIGVGYDAVEVRATSRRRVPLMVAG